MEEYFKKVYIRKPEDCPQDDQVYMCEEYNDPWGGCLKYKSAEAIRISWESINCVYIPIDDIAKIKT